MSDKIGIVSMYYNSHNYGGLLQSYALTKFLNKNGYAAEQIKYDGLKYVTPFKKKLTLKTVIKKAIHKIKRKIYKPHKNKLQAIYHEDIIKRNRIMDTFAGKIPSSEKVYTDTTLKDCVKNYSVFITGSDQVWNMNWYIKEYFLDFVSEKYKFSYAASMPNTDLSVLEQDAIKKHLNEFQSISVRELKTSAYLSKLLNRAVECVLDPTLLLSENDWNEICSKRLFDEKYIFCYFLGNDKKMRKETKKFAKKMNLQIVTLPHLCGVNFSDVSFGDKKLYDVSPESFISLIKHAEYVITDSFHACVFSNIYRKKYFVFSRKGANAMDERIISLLDIFNSEKRFVKEDEKNYLYNNRNLEVNTDFIRYHEMKNKSIKFLFENLKNAGMDITYEK